MKFCGKKKEYILQGLSYFNMENSSETVLFLEHFLRLLRKTMKWKQKKGILILCIGTDRSTGDCLGPLIGYKLRKEKFQNVVVMGTLENPVHAGNLSESLRKIRDQYPDHLVIAIDASVGKDDSVGYITLEEGPLYPGLGVKKELEAIGDISITGIVGCLTEGDPLFLQSIRLSVVMKMADAISRCLSVVMIHMENTVENFYGSESFV